MKTRLRAALAVLTCALAIPAAAAAACTGAGVITRIEGLPQEVQIARLNDRGGRETVPRVRVLEVVCAGDVIHAAGKTSVSLSLDGAGRVRVDADHPYTAASRSGVPTMAGNAYRAVNERLMPDMKRQPWDVRLRGGSPPLSFAISNLSAGGQTLSAAHSALLVRLAAGSGPYRVELRRAGEAQPLAAATSQDGDVLLSGLRLVPGRYEIHAADQNGGDVTAPLNVVAAGPPASTDYSALPDPESAAAAAAADLARTAPQTWAFEAEQMLVAAPTLGLDRASIFDLIESYASD